MDVQKHEDIIRELKRTGKLFEDAEFPPQMAINFPGSWKRSYVQWARPPQIEAGAKFIKDGLSRFDINQGGLNNCWFLASVAALTERPGLLSKVVLPGQSFDRRDYCGAFRFRFMPFGREVEIMVDDRLPVNSRREPTYARPHNGEYWVCLLEKAFAKLHGCYEALEFGELLEGLTDMTGGVCEMLYWNGPWPASDMLPRYLSKCLSKRLFATAGTRAARNEQERYEFVRLGMVPGHAYSVTGAKQIEDNRQRVDLLRVSNPYGPLGNMEWSGDWSDKSSLWTREQKRQVGQTDALDGEGWMKVAVFQHFFSQLAILHLARNSDRGVTGSEWNGHKIHGEWTPNQDVSVFFRDRNYQIDFTDRMTDDDNLATCVISLEEPGQRRLPPAQRRYVAKAVYIFRQDNLAVPVAKLEVRASRRTVEGHLTLPPGRYTVVPRALTPINGPRLEFLLRVFTEAED